MNEMKIWIDADSCPRTVRKYSVKFAEKNKIQIFFVANRVITCESGNYTMIVCDNGSDSADKYILENAGIFDIVITRDIPFADKLVEKGIAVINDRGTEFTKKNIKEKLADRDFDFQLAQIGFAGNKHTSYSKKNITDFINCFNKVTSRLLLK